MNFDDNYNAIKNSRYFYLSLTLAVTSIFVVFAIRPAAIEAIETYKNLQELKRIESQLEVKREQLTKAQDLMHTYSGEIQKMDEVFPYQSEESNLLSNFNQSAINNNVIIERVIFEDEKEKEEGPFNAAQYEITIEGTYPNVEGFIGEMYDYLRLTSIDKINITPDAVFEDSRVEAVISGTFFYKNEL